MRIITIIIMMMIMMTVVKKWRLQRQSKYEN
jgi:hypothetical protein